MRRMLANECHPASGVSEEQPSGAEARAISAWSMRGLKPVPFIRIRLISASLCCGIALVAVTGISALAQSAAPAAARPAYVPPAARGYRIAGTVVNAENGEPLSRATVTALSEADRQAVASVETDNEGRFALEGMAAGKYPLTASKRGFLTSYYEEHDGGFSTAIVTGADQDTDGLIFRLTPGATLHGVVSGDGGDPVDGAEVMLFAKPRFQHPGARITQVGSARTDDTGAYDFFDLVAGEYLLAVKAEPWYAMHRPAGASQSPENEAAAALDVAYPVTYFDSTTDEASATAVVLEGGGREVANVNLHSVPALHLFVPIPGEDSAIHELIQPQPSTMKRTVFGTQVWTAVSFSQASKASEMAEFDGVAPGHYELTEGDPPRVMELDATTSQQVDPSLGTPVVSVKGSLRSASGAPLPSKITLILSPLEVAHPADQLVITASQGSFQFPSVQPGSWELLALRGAGTDAAKQVSIVSTTTGGKTHAGNLVTSGDKPLTLTVTLSDSDTRVEGFARKDKKDQAGVLVLLVPKDPAAYRSLMRIDQSDSDGSFSLRDVAPGAYTVVAIEDGWELDRERPEVIAHYLSQGVAVTVTGSSGKIVQIAAGVPVQSR